MKNSKITLLIFLWTALGTACQEEDSVSEAAPIVPSVAEALRGNMWELQAWTARYADGATQEITLESCDIDTWEFYEQENLFIIYAHWRTGYTSEEQRCEEEFYRIVQSYQREGDTLILEGPDQGFVAAWTDYTLSDIRIVPVSEEKLTITYWIHGTGEDATEREREGIQMIQEFVRSGVTL